MPVPAEDLIQLSAYIDGELDGDEAGRIAMRLVTNLALAEEYEMLKQIRDMLSYLDKIDCTVVAASPAFEPKLYRHLRPLRSNCPNNSVTLTSVSRT